LKPTILGRRDPLDGKGDRLFNYPNGKWKAIWGAIKQQLDKIMLLILHNITWLTPQSQPYVEVEFQ
jgi:hypothetical protein